MNDKRYICPYSNIEYGGVCPVFDCPANIAHLLKPSGCAFNFLGGKKELDENDISYVFDIPLNQVRLQVNDGKTRIRNAVLLHDIVTRIKEHKTGNHCPKCGVKKQSKGPCLNTKNCDEREKLVAKVCNSYPYNTPDFKFEASDVYLLVLNLDKIKQFVKMTNEKTNGDLKVASLLGIPKSTLEKLKELSISLRT